MDASWRTDGLWQWRNDISYVSDGSQVWSGPAASWCRASHEERTAPHNRARLSQEGVEAVWRVIEQEAGRRLSTIEMPPQRSGMGMN
ncbi:MAG: hypothetical protein KF768_13685 [Phycisphaeraceae bacterium]|nr:hypothetical protein [Phycisphaeraceae bacterium]